MGLFDIFKSKGRRDTDSMFGKVIAQLFPNGEADIIRDCERVARLTRRKIPDDKLRGFLVGCKTLVAISQEHTEATFVRSFIVRSENRISESEAKDVYAYLAGEANYIDNMNRIMPGAGGGTEARRMFEAGTYEDAISGGQGPFGISLHNPIPTICVRSSNEYLARLRHQGRPIQSERIGSSSSPVTPGSIDIYTVSISGRSLGKIYLCPYHKNTSKLAPEGFTLQQA